MKGGRHSTCHDVVMTAGEGQGVTTDPRSPVKLQQGWGSLPRLPTGCAAVKATTCPVDVPRAAAAQVCNVWDVSAGQRLRPAPAGPAFGITGRRARGHGQWL